MIDTMRVLVVDDEPQITRVLQTVLASQGYAVRTAPEGRSALSTFTGWRPHLVLTDLCMPHMDGIELCRRIRAVSKVPIVVLSVKAGERAKVEALDAGADDYLTKPFGTDELPASVRRCGVRPTTPGTWRRLKSATSGSISRRVEYTSAATRCD